MGIFRDAGVSHSDRSLGDRKRHRELVEDAVKHNLTEIVAEESIIGQRGDKIIKVPVKGVKEYQFVYWRYRDGAGAGKGGEQGGQTIGSTDGRDEGAGRGGRPGTNPGEEIYETEITVEELIDYLYEELMLPALERKRLALIESPRCRRSGYQRAGIPPRLAKRRTLAEKLRREQGERRRLWAEDGDGQTVWPQDAEPETGPFRREDFRYQRVREDRDRYSNAVIICIMDASGSMDVTKKFLARSFYFLLYQFVRRKYAQVELVFIAHTSEAKEVSEDDFFHRGESGGTVISSGYDKALEVIGQRYDPGIWNIYVFHCSDGDNAGEDNPRAVELAGRLCAVSNLFGYAEIHSFSLEETVRQEFLKNIRASNFVSAAITRKEDIWPAFKRMLAMDPQPEGELEWPSTL